MSDAEQTGGFAVSHHEASGAVVLRVEGELALGTAEDLRMTGEAAAGEGPMVVDLEQVTFLDSTGLRALLEIQRQCFAAGSPMAILRPARQVLRVLELTHLRAEFDLIDDLDPAAIAALGVRSS